MWEGLVRAPRGRLSTRKLMMLLTTCLVAVFAQLTILTTPARAADAYWKDGSIVYAGHTYAQQVSNPDDNLGLIADTPYYLYTEDIPGVTAKKAYVIYFGSNTSPPTATSATYKTYTLANGKFTNPSGEKQLTIEPPQSQTGPSKSNGSSCDVPNGLGWILCSVSRTIANAMDYVYGIISDFLSVQPLQTTQQGPLYKAWDIARNMANLSFIVGFLVVIYAQITGGVLTNYSIKKIMPRIIVTAILINISYWICAVVVDLSNILGYSINDFFISIRQSIGAPLATLTWTDVTEFVLTSGTVAGGTVAGYTALLTASGGSIFSVFYLLLMVMVSVIFAALVALIILAMRQALITVLIITAPLAFVLYLLPNTEKWFSKWREAFAAMMFMFPIFSVIFGGSQLASAVIIQNAKSPAVAILGLAVQVAPLVVTPMIIKFSGSLLGRIAGMVNNSKKGLFDRTKNALKDRADYHAARGREKGAEFQRLNKKSPWYRPTSQAYRHERAKQKREDWKKGFEERTAQAIHADEKYQRGRRESYNPTSDEYNKRQNLDTYKRTTDLQHKNTESEHNKHWNELLDPNSGHADPELLTLRSKTHVTDKQAKGAEDSLNAYLRDLDAGKNTIKLSNLTHVNRTAAEKQKVIDELSHLATSAQLANQRVFIEGERLKSAEITIQNQMSDLFKDNTVRINGTTVREYAGGIAGQSGANRVYAEAKAKGVAAYMEEVKNSRSILSDHSIIEVLDIAMKGKRRDGTKATEAEIDAAIQETLLAKGNNWSVQKLKDHVASQGMHYDEATNKYYEDKAKTIEVTDPEIIEARRTRQQIFVDAYNQSKHKVQNLSGTDRGMLENGTFTLSSADTILRDIRDQKINASRIASTDIDELMRMVQVLRDDKARDNLRRTSPEAYKTLTETIDFALKDPQVRASIAPREQKMIGVIQKYINDPRPVIPTADKKAYEASTETPIPTHYDVDRFYDVPDKFGGSEPTGPL